MSFLGKANFCINGHSQLWRLCRVIQRDMLGVYHSPTHLFFHVYFSPSSLCQLDQLAKLQQSPVPLQFPLPDVVIATDATPTRWAFYFQGSGLPLSVSGTWSGTLSRAHIALQELQAVAVMLRTMAFCLSGKVVALHLDNSTAKASPFLSRLACQILSLTDKHGITLLPWKFQVSYVFPPPALVPLVLSKFLAEHVNGQLRHLLLVAPCWMEAHWLPTVLSMLADVPRQCPIIIDLVVVVLVGQALKGLWHLHLTLWLLSDVCYANKGSLPQSVRQWGGNSNVYIKGLPAVLEGVGWLVCLTGFTKQCHLCP